VSRKSQVDFSLRKIHPAHTWRIDGNSENALEWFRPHSLWGVHLLAGFRPLLVAILAFPVATHAASAYRLRRFPRDAFHRLHRHVNGQTVDVAHAAASYEFVSFDVTGPVEWPSPPTSRASGSRRRYPALAAWNPANRQGQTIRFRLRGPAKLSISRPGDFLNHARMLFLFAGTPPPPRPLAPTSHYPCWRPPREPEP